MTKRIDTDIVPKCAGVRDDIDICKLIDEFNS